MSTPVKSLSRGDLVVALRAIDISGADVSFGELGVVFELDGWSDATRQYGYPLVRWLGGSACAVHDGDVAVQPDWSKERERLSNMNIGGLS